MEGYNKNISLIILEYESAMNASMDVIKFFRYPSAPLPVSTLAFASRNRLESLLDVPDIIWRKSLLISYIYMILPPLP